MNSSIWIMEVSTWNYHFFFVSEFRAFFFGIFFGLSANESKTNWKNWQEYWRRAWMKFYVREMQLVFSKNRTIHIASHRIGNECIVIITFFKWVHVDNNKHSYMQFMLITQSVFISAYKCDEENGCCAHEGKRR